MYVVFTMSIFMPPADGGTQFDFGMMSLRALRYSALCRGGGLRKNSSVLR